MLERRKGFSLALDLSLWCCWLACMCWSTCCIKWGKMGAGSRHHPGNLERGELYGQFSRQGIHLSTQSRIHRYIGQFRMDPTAGWRYGPAPDRYAIPRKVIVFTLTRGVAAPAADPQPDQYMVGKSTGTLTVTEAPRRADSSEHRSPHQNRGHGNYSDRAPT